jgi:phospholipid transport system transporter-binding protein
MNKCLEFKLSAELTLQTVQLDRDRLLLDLKNESVSNLRFDLSAVSQCDSAGLAFLIEAKRLCDQFKKEFSFYAIPQDVQTLAEFCGIDEILNS